MTRALLVRHAQPDESVRDRVYGSLDVSLSAQGRERARDLAAVLVEEHPVALYTSPLARARETAAPLAAELGLEPIDLDGLRELDFGDLEGLPVEEACARFPQALDWIAAPSARVFPGGESAVELRARALRALAEIAERHPDDTVVVFSHSLPIRFVLADALGLDPDSIFRFDVAYGNISIVEWRDGAPFVRIVNADRNH
jgi:ribonuclease H / adenosylcobalamin/alpha-ribazole phosphatase